jgi:hypothetical protein
MTSSRTATKIYIAARFRVKTFFTKLAAVYSKTEDYEIYQRIESTLGVQNDCLSLSYDFEFRDRSFLFFDLTVCNYSDKLLDP